MSSYLIYKLSITWVKDWQHFQAEIFIPGFKEDNWLTFLSATNNLKNLKNSIIVQGGRPWQKITLWFTPLSRLLSSENVNVDTSHFLFNICHTCYKLCLKSEKGYGNINAFWEVYSMSSSALEADLKLKSCCSGFQDLWYINFFLT